MDYISNLDNAAELCEKFKEDLLGSFTRLKEKGAEPMQKFVWAPPYRRGFAPIKACADMCRVLKLPYFGKYEAIFYSTISDLEDPDEMKDENNFKGAIEATQECFELASKELRAFCLSFDEEEKERVNEAIHNFLEDCNYSCVAMSVSAAESRLLKLMCLASPDSEGKLEKKTLGQLINEYVNNKDDYQNVVPEKHEPLLQLCNTYRTFSVHPKKQRITGRLATSILNLAIEFLTDQDTKPEVVKAQLIAREGGK